MAVTRLGLHGAAAAYAGFAAKAESSATGGRLLLLGVGSCWLFWLCARAVVTP